MLKCKYWMFAILIPKWDIDSHSNTLDLRIVASSATGIDETLQGCIAVFDRCSYFYASINVNSTFVVWRHSERFYQLLGASCVIICIGQNIHFFFTSVGICGIPQAIFKQYKKMNILAYNILSGAATAAEIK